MDANRKMLALSAFSGVVFGILTAASSGVFPRLYNTTDDIRLLATRLILISAVCMPLQGYSFPVYFTLRAGGKTLVTFLFDCGAIWALYLPIAFSLSRFTSLSILAIFALCNATDLVKCIAGYLLIKRGDWIQNLAEQ